MQFQSQPNHQTPNQSQLNISEQPNHLQHQYQDQQQQPQQQLQQQQNNESIATKSFYSSKDQPTKTTTSSSGTAPSRSSGVSSSTAVVKTTSQLSTWQADVKSQLQLPEDFTPELIAQLASEGYDLTASGGRKARARAPPPSFQQQQVVKKDRKRNIESLSSSESDNNGENDDLTDNYEANTAAARKKFSEHGKGSGATPSKIMKRNDHQTSSLTRVKYDYQADPTDHPAYKRFTQLLDEVLDSYEQDLEHIAYSRKTVSMNGQEEEEIPPEYLLSKNLCAELAQEAFKLNSYSIMDAVKKENLVKLQNLLFFNIKDGFRALHLMHNEVYYEIA